MAACLYHVAGADLPAARRDAIARGLRATITADGSVGLHFENAGCLFTSVLTYVALRLLGTPPDDADAARLRAWIRDRGGPLYAAPWAKHALAILNLYEYDGLLPVPPELWTLPRALPFHPGRTWCHARQVYLALAALYGLRAAIPETPLIRDLRCELYDIPYPRVPFARHRLSVGAEDSLFPPGRLLRTAANALALYERHRSVGWRKRALDAVMRHIDYEEDITGGLCIGPVNRVLNAMVYCFRRPGGARLMRALDAVGEYLFDTDDGCTRMNGYNHCGLWDTAFAVQAVLTTRLAEERADTLGRAAEYIRRNQMTDDPPDRRRFHRGPSRGGWPFSDRRHGWPISDCTGEALLCAFQLGERFGERFETHRLHAAVDLILRLQNADGGWATYERRRAPRWLERLNPSFVFDRIMVEHSCVECSSACVRALVASQTASADHRPRDIRRAIRRGVRFIEREQRRNGSWEGSWGVCFTYGTWFGVAGLRGAGRSPEDAPIQRACDFLVAHRNADGGWGESWRNCVERRYTAGAASTAANTAWALLTLVLGGRAASAEAAAAAQFLLDRQQPDGDWPREPMTGVFNRSALIRYDNYRRYFPIRALATWNRTRGG
jgi:squalene/oxidosqualene cyclase-like protein